MTEPERKRMRMHEQPRREQEALPAAAMEEIVMTTTDETTSKVTRTFCALCDEEAETNEVWRNYCFGCNCAVVRDSQGCSH